MTCSVKQTIVDRLEIDKLVEHDGTGFRIIGDHNQIKTTLGDFTASLTRSHGIAEPPFSIGPEYVVLNDELLDTIYEIDNGITPPPTEEVVSAEQELLQSVNMILTKLGLTSKSVDKLRDREGNPLKGVAVADILHRSIQYLEGKQEEVPEEVIHFFVQALKELNDPLYISMAERVHKEPEYAEVLTTYSDLGYSEEDLLDEAIAKVILNRILTTLKSSKPGVAELFDSNPELANAVYEALGFTNLKSKVTLSKKFADTYNIVFNGETIGTIDIPSDLEGDTISIGYVNIKPEFRGKGLGVETYKAAMTIAGKPLESFMATDEANRVWNSLIKQGLAKKTDTGFVTVTSQITPQQKQQALQQYSQYLDSIFPDSQVKDIVYHGSRNADKFDNFDDNLIGELDSGFFGRGIYFSPDVKYAQGYANKGYNNKAGQLYAVVVNLQNPLNTDANQANKNWGTDVIKNYDGALVTEGAWSNPELNGEEPAGYNPNTLGEIVVKSSSQTHILGSKQDVEGFKKFAGKPVEATGDRNTRWWGRVKKKLQSVFNSDKSDPFMEAAKEMFQNDLSRYADAISTSKRETMFRSVENRNAQSVISKNIIEMNASMKLQAAPRDALGRMPDDAFAILSAKGGADTIMRYINVLTGKFVTWRGTDKKAIKNAKRYADVKMSEATIDKSEKMSDYGTNLHAFSQLLAINWAKSAKNSGENGPYKDILNVVDTTQGEPQPTLEELLELLQLDRESVNSMNTAVKEIVDDIVDVQTKINKKNKKNDKVDLYTEFKVRLDKKDKAGTIDMMFVFSDSTGAIFDYKFTAPEGWNSPALVVDPFRDQIDSFEDQMGFYKDAVRALGVTSLRRTRVIPGALKLKKNAEKKIIGIASVSMGSKTDKFLSPIPLLRETADEDIDFSLESLNTSIASLNELLKEFSGDRLTSEQKRTKQTIHQTIRELLTRSDLRQTMEDMKILYEDLESRVDIEDKEDPRYLSTATMNSAVEMIEIFKRIPEAIANSGGHLTDASKKTLTESIGKLTLFGDKLIGMYKERVLEDSGVNLSVISNAPSMMHKFVSFRESNNIIVSYVAMTIDMANEAANNEYRELYEKWEGLHDGLVKWAEENGKSVQQAYNMLHRTTKSGKKLVRVFKESFSEKKNKYLKDFRNGTPEEKALAQKWLRENLEIRPDAEAEYAKNLDLKVKALLGEYGSTSSPSYGRNLAYFIANNNVWTSLDAWGSPSYYKYLQFKPSVVEANYSAEYAELKKGGNELLLEYYEAWQKQMKDFDSMITGVTVPYNMIPNVHASPVEKWVEGKLGIKSVLRDLRLSLTLDVENEERSSKDTSRSIPLRYMQPLRDNAGNLTPEFVSAELTPALLEFGMSVLRHKHRQNIQPDVMMAQRILESPKAQEYYEEGGERKLRKVSAETQATLNKAIQMKLYDLGLGGTPNGKKVQAAMGLFSKIVMTIPIKSAAAAFVSGAIFGNSQLKSNPNFGEASLMEAMKFLFTNREKGNVIADYFNIYQEGDLRMHSRTMRHNFFTRWANSDYLYSPLRPTDEIGDRRMFIAMLSNYSVDENGLFQRLEDLPIGAKSALEQLEVSNGKLLTKILPSERTKMSMMFKAEMGAVRGSNTPMDIAEYQSEIFASAVMQFKGWMPAMILGRYGDVKYDKYLYRMKEGRISGAYKSLKLKYSQEDLEGKTASSLLLASTAEKAYNVLAGLLSDKNYILTKREYEQLEKGGKLNDKKIANFEKRRAALRKEMDIIRQNSTDPHLVNMTEESFFRLREASVRSTLFEMRAIIVVMLVSMLLNGLADDDEDESYATQMGAVMLDRLLLEIRMFLNPFEILNLNNGIPVLGLLQMIQRLAFSSADLTFQALTEDEVDFSGFNKALLSPLPGYSAYKFIAN